VTTTEAKSRIWAIQPGIFEGMAEHKVREFIAHSEVQNVKHGCTIFPQDAPAKHFGLLVSGRARYCYYTRNGEKLILKWLKEGEMIGASALFPRPTNYLASVESVRDSTIVVWSRRIIRELVAQDSRLLANALVSASTYLDWYIATHVALVFQSAPQRLAHVLATLASAIGRKTDSGMLIDVTNEELALAANITPFTASRLLVRWQKRALITKSRGSILVESPERLWQESL
jgi:CRP-like cAMP-binding protein